MHGFYFGKTVKVVGDDSWNVYEFIFIGTREL